MINLNEESAARGRQRPHEAFSAKSLGGAFSTLNPHVYEFPAAAVTRGTFPTRPIYYLTALGLRIGNAFTSLERRQQAAFLPAAYTGIAFLAFIAV